MATLKLPGEQSATESPAQPPEPGGGGESPLFTGDAPDRLDDPRINAAHHLIKNHVIAAMGLSLVPVPLLDLMVLSGLQLRLVRRLAKLYGLPFHRDLGRSLLAALLGGVLPTSVALSAASLAKVVPGAGTAVGIVSVSTLGGASTYAVGHAFLRHFATGGDLLSFDSKAMSGYFQASFQEGKQVVATLSREDEDHKSSP